LDIERGASVSEPGKTGEALNRMAEGNVGCWLLTLDPVAMLGKSSRNTAFLREGLRY